MKRLDEVDWGSFRMLDILDISPCSFTGRSSSPHGNVPYVGATNRNNGVLDFLDVSSDGVIEGNCIVFICNGQGSIGYSIYRESSFVGSVDVKIGRSPYLNRYVGTFITTAADKMRTHYSFGYKRTLSRLKNEIIRLPQTKDGDPDYAFMEEYMKEIERKMLLRYRCYLEEHKLSISNTSCSNVEYRTFKIGSLFTVKRPNSRNKDNYDKGDVCFVASGAENNGVVKYCSPKIGEQLDAGNCLTVSPVDGSCFYQPADFLGRGGGGSSILLLYSKNFVLNKYIGLYISEAIKKTTTSKYCYGHMATNESIIRDTIQLPVTSSGEVDYTYMEKYMKAKEAEMLKRYIDYKLAKI